MDSCPKELEPYNRAHRKQIEEQDELQYLWWANYGISAFMVAIDRCFNGQNAKREFTKETVTSIIYENYGLTEEEIKERELEKFFADNAKMRADWKRKKKKQQ